MASSGTFWNGTPNNRIQGQAVRYDVHRFFMPRIQSSQSRSLPPGIYSMTVWAPSPQGFHRQCCAMLLADRAAKAQVLFENCISMRMRIVIGRHPIGDVTDDDKGQEGTESPPYSSTSTWKQMPCRLTFCQLWQLTCLLSPCL